MERFGVIPLWKVRRELARFGQQLRAIPEAMWEPFAQARHDRAATAGFAVQNGDAVLGAKVALVLLYQPKGVGASTIAMCAHLVARGYAPFVVSNAPLSAQDWAQLAPVSWRVMVRPNFGYDFGGYRDGILQLMAWDIVPAHLLVMNDSIWFPVVPDERMLTQLETSSADLTGTILRERGAERFLESYCYMIPRGTYEHPAFVAFWRELRLTSNKYKVIRRGERGFSRAMIAAGLRVVGLYTTSDFLARMAVQTDEFLETTVRCSASVTPALEAARLAVLARRAEAGWRELALAHIAKTLAREQIYAAYPFAMAQFYDYPILKKSKDRAAVVWRRGYVRAVQNSDMPPPPPPFLEEVRCQTRADPL
jgi:hypothetical protein